MAWRKQQAYAEILSEDVLDIVLFQSESALDHSEMEEWRDAWMAKKRDNIQAIAGFMNRSRNHSRIARKLLFALLEHPPEYCEVEGGLDSVSTPWYSRGIGHPT